MMKKRIVTIFVILVFVLTACAPDAGKPLPDAEKTPVMSVNVMLPGGALPDRGYRPPETPERCYTDPVSGLIPSGDYGRIWPYLGGYVAGQYVSPREYIGICDESGRVICDPVYNEAKLVEKDGRGFYIFIKSNLRAINRNANPSQYDDRSEITLATTDGSYVETFEYLLWEERRPFEYSTVFDENGYAYTYEWRRPVSYDYITAWRDGKWGVLDWDGSVLLPFKYLEPVCFHEGLAAVLSEDERNYSFIDIKGKTVLGPYDAPPRLKDSWLEVSGREIPSTDRILFIDGYAKFYEAGKFGIIDSTGEIIIPAEYDYISCISDGIAMFANYTYRGDNKPVVELIGIVNDSGNVIVEPAEYTYYNRPVNEDGCAVLYPSSIELKQKVDSDGNKTPYEIDKYYYSFMNNYIFLDAEGNEKRLPTADFSIDELNDELLIVFDKTAETWRLYDYALNPLSPENPGLYATWPLIRGKAEYFFIMEPAAAGNSRYLCRIYGLDGRQMLEGSYYTIIPIGDKFMVRGNMSAGLVDKNGSYIIEVSMAEYNAD